MNIKPHEKWAWVVCAYRLDPSRTAEQFVEALERYEAAVRRDEREKLQSEKVSDRKENER